MKTYDTILFDLDGTLINSSKGILNSLFYALDKEGVDYTGKDILPILGPPLDDGLRMLYPDLFKDNQYLNYFVKLFREHYAKIGINECEIYEGVEDLIRELHANNKKLIIATSKPTVMAEHSLNSFNLSKYFHLIVGSNLDLTRSIKSEVISHVLSQLAEDDKKNIVMIGDRRHDMEGAKHHGIDRIGVTYGYGSHEELKAYDPIHVLDNVPALKEILLWAK